MRSLLLPALCVTLLLSGCAAILSGTKQRVSFTSDPPGAQVVANGQTICTTPCSAELKKKNDYTIEIRKSGYAPGRAQLESSVGGGWIVADILFGGLIGIAVDGLTGAWNSFDNDSVHVSFGTGPK